MLVECVPNRILLTRTRGFVYFYRVIPIDVDEKDSTENSRVGSLADRFVNKNSTKRD